MNKLKEIIKQAIDIHVHIGPEVIPRKFNAVDLTKREKGRLYGAVLKNHFYSTVPFIKELKSTKGLRLVGSIVLNNSVGGINPEAIYIQTLLTSKPFFVWFPTINAENFLKKSKYETDPLWVKKKSFTARESREVKKIQIFENNSLNTNTIQVLELIKKYDLVLATGHISWQESVKLIHKALQIGITKIVITHPIYQKINMPLKTQKNLSNLGCYIEQSYSTYSIDKIPIEKIAKQIKYIGSKSVILSSDVGQTFSPLPSDALLKFAILLKKEGIKNEEIFEMMVKNPRLLLNF